MRRLPDHGPGLEQARRLAPDWVLFEPEWLARAGLRCVAQPSNMDLPENLAAEYARLVGSRGSAYIQVVTCDATLPDQFGFASDATPQDLAAALDGVYGLPFLVFVHDDRAPALLVTDADYRIIAGLEADLRILVGDMRAARDEFARSAWDSHPASDALLKAALATMDWIV